MLCRVLGVALLCVVSTVASAQTLPDQPVTFGDGRVVVSGDASVSVAPEDTGFFNYSDYEHSTLREFRAELSALIRATDRIAFLGQIRSENLDAPSAYALFARIRPFPGRRFDVQIGRIPPTFGGFTRQAYGRDNPLIGYPLAYQYLTSVRADALPGDADELLRMRGRGWLANYSVGNLAADRGVPLVSAFTWDTGVQVSGGWKTIDLVAAITNGTTSRPVVSDDNAGKQIAARVVAHVTPSLAVGTSYARGAFVGRRALAAAGLSEDATFAQQAIGIDASYEVGHLVVRTEAITSAWQVPLAAARQSLTLRATAVGAEGKYAFLPGAYAAIRAERLMFNEIAGTAQRQTWDAPVTRLEVGGGYYLQRNLIARGSLQLNERDGGRVTSSRLAAAQLLFWF